MFIWVTDVNSDKRVAINPFLIKKISRGMGGTFIEFLTDTDDTRYFAVKEADITIIQLAEDAVEELVRAIKGEDHDEA